MMDKILTIVVPTYNMEKYLDRCLSSLVVDDDRMAILEVLVVNDGSKDRSSEIAHGYESKYPETFRVIDKENGNYGSCINAALPVAKGKYIKILDADDWFSGLFSEFISFLAAVDVDMVLSGFSFVSEGRGDSESMTYEFPTDEDIPFSNLVNCPDIWMHAVTYKTCNVRESGYRQSEGISYTDQEWIFFPMKTVKFFRYFNGSVYQYLQGREGQTVDMNVWLRHSAQEIFGAGVMLDQYSENGSEVSQVVRSYWENRIRQRSSFIYQRVLLSSLSTDLSESGISGFDDKLMKICPSVYHSFDDTPVSPKVGYKFISEWRNNGYRRPLRLKSIILAKQLRNFILKVTGK